MASIRSNRGFAFFTVLSLAGLVEAGELTPMTVSLTGEGFEKIADEFGVKVFKDPDAEIIRVAAEGRFAAPPERVMKVLLDYEGQVGVVERVSKSQVLSKGPGWMLVYQWLNLPVISDRDYTLRVTWGADGDVLWIDYRAIADRGPERQDGVVRVTHHTGSWQLLPIRGNRATLARFQVSIDLAGSLPRWLARSGAGDELPGLFQNIRRMLVRSMPVGTSCSTSRC